MKSFKTHLSEQTVKVVKKGKTKRGEPVMLAKSPNGNYHVWIQKTNYSAGRDVKRWFKISKQRNMSHKDEQEYLKTGEPDLATAEKLFKRRATGGVE